MMGMLDEPNYWAIIKIAAIRLASRGRIKARAFAPKKRRGRRRVELAGPLKVARLLLKRRVIMV